MGNNKEQNKNKAKQNSNEQQTQTSYEKNNHPTGKSGNNHAATLNENGTTK